MPVFWWMAVRFEMTRARYSFSLPQLSSFAYSITGMDAVMPWFPLPELMMTGSSQPFIRASLPAAALALARTLMSCP